MRYHSLGVENQSRLEDAMMWLDPQSREIMELWLMGLDRRAISSELGMEERMVVAACDSAFQQLRMLLAQR